MHEISGASDQHPEAHNTTHLHYNLDIFEEVNNKTKENHRVFDTNYFRLMTNWLGT